MKTTAETTDAARDAGHTPGPWRVWFGPNEALAVVGPDRFALARVNDITSTASPQDHANARLISASPDLLAALENLLAFDDDSHGSINSEESTVRQAARKAIAKARP